MKPKSAANKIDALMGRVLRDNRIIAGVTQKELAQNSRISFQQIQKYESGANRISISRLFEVADALGVKASDLVIAVENLQEISGGHKGERYQNDVNNKNRAKTHALRSLSSIDDRLALETITTVLELFKRLNGICQRENTTSATKE